MQKKILLVMMIFFSITLTAQDREKGEKSPREMTVDELYECYIDYETKQNQIQDINLYPYKRFNEKRVSDLFNHYSIIVEATIIEKQNHIWDSLYQEPKAQAVLKIHRIFKGELPNDTIEIPVESFGNFYNKDTQDTVFVNSSILRDKEKNKGFKKGFTSIFLLNPEPQKNILGKYSTNFDRKIPRLNYQIEKIISYDATRRNLFCQSIIDSYVTYDIAKYVKSYINPEDVNGFVELIIFRKIEDVYDFIAKFVEEDVKIFDSVYFTVDKVSNIEKENANGYFLYPVKKKTNNFVSQDSLTKKIIIDPEITGFEPSNISAGIGEILTITGNNFGNQGRLFFQNIDTQVDFPIFESIIEIDPFFIQSWIDNQIIVELPAFGLNEITGEVGGFGSGFFRVVNEMGEANSIDIDPFNPSILTIDYAVRAGTTTLGIELDNNKRNILLPPFCISGHKHIIRIQQELLDQDPNVLACIENALNAWQTLSGTTWVIGSGFNGNPVDIEGFNDYNYSFIYLTNELGNPDSQMATQIKMKCEDDDAIGVKNFRIKINENTNWFYNPNFDGTFPNDSDYDFFESILHELGHTQLLLHYQEIIHLENGIYEYSKNLMSPPLINPVINQERNLSLFDDIEAIANITNYGINNPIEGCVLYSDLSIKDCTLDSGLEPSTDCDDDPSDGIYGIWKSPSLRNCYSHPPLIQGQDDSYIEPDDWICESQGISSPIYQLYDEDPNSQEDALLQYPNRFDVVIENRGCIDYNLNEGDAVLKTYWTFARTDEIWPQHWIANEESIILEDGTVVNATLGDCMRLDVDNITEEGNDGDCIEVNIGNIPANSSVITSLKWHPPSSLKTHWTAFDIDLANQGQGEPVMCLLARIESNNDPMFDEQENVGISHNVYNNNNIATRNTIFLEDATLHSQDVIIPPTPPISHFAPPTPQVNLAQVPSSNNTISGNIESINNANFTTTTNPIRIIMVNHAQTTNGTLNISFGETNPNGESVIDYGDIYIYPDKSLWNKIEETAYAGEGYEVYDTENKVLRLTDGSGLTFEGLEYEGEESRFLGIKFEQSDGKKYPPNRLIFEHYLSHTVTYIDETTQETKSRPSSSGIVFKTIVHPENTKPLSLSMDKLEIFPNPTNSQFEVSFNLEEISVISFSVIDMSGKKVKVLVKDKEYIEGNHTITLDCDNIIEGMYLLHSQDKNKTITEKIIISQ